MADKDTKNINETGSTNAAAPAVAPSAPPSTLPSAPPAEPAPLTKDDLAPGAGKSRRKWLLAAAAVVVLGAGAAWWAGVFSPAAAPSYRTAEIARGSLSVTVTANGTVNPLRTVSIGSELSGIVRNVLVDVNSVVKQGDVLIELDDANLTAEVNQARASLASARASLAEAEATQVEAEATMRRYEELNKTSGGRLPSRTELDVQRATVLKARAGVMSAKASIDDAQATLETRLTDLSKASIKSPVDGVVLARTVEPGYAVAATLQAVELLTVATDLRELELEVNVDEADVGQVRNGQRATFTVAAYPNKRFDATITKVAFGSTTSTDNVITYTTYLSVANPNLELRPGMTATATIETAHRDDALLVPNTALRFKPSVRSSGDSSGFSIRMGPPHSVGSPKKSTEVSLNQTEREQTVYVVGRDGHAEPRTIVTGLTNGRMTEIVSGDLKAGDKVITDQLQQAK